MSYQRSPDTPWSKCKNREFSPYQASRAIHHTPHFTSFLASLIEVQRLVDGLGHDVQIIEIVTATPEPAVAFVGLNEAFLSELGNAVVDGPTSHRVVTALLANLHVQPIDFMAFDRRSPRLTEVRNHP